MSQILKQSDIETACEIARAWGEEDAWSDIRPRCFLYYAPDSPQERAYLAGYEAATELIYHLTGARTVRQLGITSERPAETWHDLEDRYYDTETRLRPSNHRRNRSR
ncbi:MAG: hypothetical protein R3C14_40530 [Caldilineaceae bacterium]